MGRLHTKIKTKALFNKLFEWTEDERKWSQKDRLWYISYTLFFLLLIAISALLQSYFLMVAIIAFTFLWFIQAAIPPEKITNTVTSLGVKTYGKLFKWKNIKFFWFSFKGETYFLNLDIIDEVFTSGKRVHRLSLILDKSKLNELFNILVDYIEYGEQSEIHYNIITRALYGVHIDVATFLNIKPED